MEAPKLFQGKPDEEIENLPVVGQNEGDTILDKIFKKYINVLKVCKKYLRASDKYYLPNPTYKSIVHR